MCSSLQNTFKIKIFAGEQQNKSYIYLDNHNNDGATYIISEYEIIDTNKDYEDDVVENFNMEELAWLVDNGYADILDVSDNAGNSCFSYTFGKSTIKYF